MPRRGGFGYSLVVNTESRSKNSTTYDEIYSRFRLEAPARFNFVRDIFEPIARDPEKLALWWVDDQERELKLSFAELNRGAARLADSLARLGLRKGDRLLLVLPSIPHWWITCLACLRMGVVFSPGTTQLRGKDLSFRILQAEAAALVTTPEVAAELELQGSDLPSLRHKILVDPEPREGWLLFDECLDRGRNSAPIADTAASDPAILFFTSGTTGAPKMTLHTAVSYPLGHRITGEFWLDLKAEDVHWNLSDTGWAKAAYSSLFGPWLQAATVFVHHGQGFDPVRSLQILAKYPISTFCAAPTVYRMFVQQSLSSYKFSSLRHCVAAGEPLNPEVIRAWKEGTGIVIRDGYGQTESVLLAGSFPFIEPRSGSMGKPAPGFELAVVDADGRPIPAGREGDLAVLVAPHRPLGLFKEYWKDPERTRQTLRGDWYITGDRAYFDEDGYIWFVGRADDVILSAGYRIGPFEVESALQEHPAVAESAVVSSPDEIRGEVVKAFIVLAPGFDPSEELADQLRRHVKEQTAPYKYPRKIQFLNQLPKTISGKIRRVELRKQEWESQ